MPEAQETFEVDFAEERADVAVEECFETQSTMACQEASMAGLAGHEEELWALRILR
jgi:hypothetical protein